MKLKYDFVIREVADKTVAIPIGDATEDFDCMITLNESGAFIFGLLKQDTSREELISSFLKEYNATKEQATDTVDRFLDNLKKADILV